MRIAIATACGCDLHFDPRAFVKGEDRIVTCDLPDYLNDLNAMNEAEDYLGDDPCDGERSEWSMFKAALTAICKREECDVIHSSAAQRAEAFLKAKGLWEDD